MTLVMFKMLLGAIDILAASVIMFCVCAKSRASPVADSWCEPKAPAPKVDAWVEPVRTAYKLEQPIRFGKVDLFAKRCLWEDKNGRVSLSEVHDAYERWCAVQTLKPFSAERFIEALHDLCTYAGIDIDDSAGAVFLMGVKLQA